MSDSSPADVMRLLGQIRAYALTAIPVVFGVLLWVHEADSAHALKHAGVEVRVARNEACGTAVNAKMDGMARDIRSVMVAVGAEKATREALHSTPEQRPFHGLLQSVPGVEGDD